MRYPLGPKPSLDRQGRRDLTAIQGIRPPSAAYASRSANRMLRGLGVSAVVIAVGLLVPPVGWIVLYLAPVWFVVTGVLLAVRNR